MPTPEILAAGAVVSRKGQVLLVHRPKYDDWSFPKGKVDPDEHATTAAVREVAEETGLDIRLGPRLGDQRYTVGDGVRRDKRVHYWVGRTVGGTDVSGYRPNEEIDQVAWLDLDEALERMTYPHDRDTLEEFRAVRKRSTPLVVLRHAQAVPRRQWDGPEALRPLTEQGELQSDDVVPVLAAYGVARVVSSSARRCWTTLGPYAAVAGVEVEVTDALTEQDATAASVERVVSDLLATKEPAALCSHRPVLPHVLAAAGLAPRKLAPAGMLVVHHRHGAVVAVEHHES